MKKFIALLTAAAMILTVASCSNEPAATTPEETTPAATTTTEAPEETEAPETTDAPDETDTPEETDAPEDTEAPEDTDAPEDTEAPEETDAPDEADTPAASNDPAEVLRANAPIYANFVEDQKNFPVFLGLAYEADLYGTGVPSACTMDMAIWSLERIAAKISIDGTPQRIVIEGTRYYIISDAEETCLFMDFDESQRAELTDSMTSASLSNAQFDVLSATYETGTEEYNGTEYLFEKIYAPEGDFTVYADPATREIKYLIAAGTEMKVTAFTHDVDESIFEIPSRYIQVSMADLAN